MDQSYSAKKIRERIKVAANTLDQAGVPALTRGEKGSLIGALNRLTGGQEFYRHLMLEWLFMDRAVSGLSSKQLTNGQWRALFDWAAIWHDQDGDGKWKPCEQFTLEATIVMLAVVVDYTDYLAEVDALLQK